MVPVICSKCSSKIEFPSNYQKHLLKCNGDDHMKRTRSLSSMACRNGKDISTKRFSKSNKKSPIINKSFIDLHNIDNKGLTNDEVSYKMMQRRSMSSILNKVDSHSMNFRNKERKLKDSKKSIDSKKPIDSKKSTDSKYQRTSLDESNLIINGIYKPQRRNSTILKRNSLNIAFSENHGLFDSNNIFNNKKTRQKSLSSTNIHNQCESLSPKKRNTNNKNVLKLKNEESYEEIISDLTESKCITRSQQLLSHMPIMEKDKLSTKSSLLKLNVDQVANISSNQVENYSVSRRNQQHLISNKGTQKMPYEDLNFHYCDAGIKTRRQLSLIKFENDDKDIKRNFEHIKSSSRSDQLEIPETSLNNKENINASISSERDNFKLKRGHSLFPRFSRDLITPVNLVTDVNNSKTKDSCCKTRQHRLLNSIHKIAPNNNSDSSIKVNNIDNSRSKVINNNLPYQHQNIEEVRKYKKLSLPTNITNVDVVETESSTRLHRTQKSPWVHGIMDCDIKIPTKIKEIDISIINQRRKRKLPIENERIITRQQSLYSISSKNYSSRFLPESIFCNDKSKIRKLDNKEEISRSKAVHLEDRISKKVDMKSSIQKVINNENDNEFDYNVSSRGFAEKRISKRVSSRGNYEGITEVNSDNIKLRTRQQKSYNKISSIDRDDHSTEIVTGRRCTKTTKSTAIVNSGIRRHRSMYHDRICKDVVIIDDYNVVKEVKASNTIIEESGGNKCPKTVIDRKGVWSYVKEIQESFIDLSGCNNVNEGIDINAKVQAVNDPNVGCNVGNVDNRTIHPSDVSDPITDIYSSPSIITEEMKLTPGRINDDFIGCDSSLPVIARHCNGNVSVVIDKSNKSEHGNEYIKASIDDGLSLNLTVDIEEDVDGGLNNNCLDDDTFPHILGTEHGNDSFINTNSGDCLSLNIIVDKNDIISPEANIKDEVIKSPNMNSELVEGKLNFYDSSDDDDLSLSDTTDLAEMSLLSGNVNDASVIMGDSESGDNELSPYTRNEMENLSPQTDDDSIIVLSPNIVNNDHINNESSMDTPILDNMNKIDGKIDGDIYDCIDDDLLSILISAIEERKTNAMNIDIDDFKLPCKDVPVVEKIEEEQLNVKINSSFIDDGDRHRISLNMPSINEDDRNKVSILDSTDEDKKKEVMDIVGIIDSNDYKSSFEDIPAFLEMNEEQLDIKMNSSVIDESDGSSISLKIQSINDNDLDIVSILDLNDEEQSTKVMNTIEDKRKEEQLDVTRKRFDIDEGDIHSISLNMQSINVDDRNGISILESIDEEKIFKVINTSSGIEIDDYKLSYEDVPVVEKRKRKPLAIKRNNSQVKENGGHSVSVKKQNINDDGQDFIPIRNSSNEERSPVVNDTLVSTDSNILCEMSPPIICVFIGATDIVDTARLISPVGDGLSSREHEIAITDAVAITVQGSEGLSSSDATGIVETQSVGRDVVRVNDGVSMVDTNIENGKDVITSADCDSMAASSGNGTLQLTTKDIGFKDAYSPVFRKNSKSFSDLTNLKPTTEYINHRHYLKEPIDKENKSHSAINKKLSNVKVRVQPLRPDQHETDSREIHRTDESDRVSKVSNLLFKCKLCPQTFDSLCQLQTHNLIHNLDMSSSTSKLSSSSSKQIDHKRTRGNTKKRKAPHTGFSKSVKEPSRKKYRCAKCVLTFTNSQAQSNHFAIHHRQDNKEPVGRELIQSVSRSMQVKEIQEKVLREFFPSQYGCGRCGLMFKTTVRLNNHKSTVHCNSSSSRTL